MSLVDLVVPSMGESVTTATLARWLKQPGEPVRADESVASVDSDKATADLPSPVAGVLAEHLVEEGAELTIGQVIARIAVDVAADVSAAGGAAEPGSASTAEAAPSAGPTGPAARHALREAGVEAWAVQGSGRGGRIHAADVAVSVEAASQPGKPRRQPRSGTERLMALGYTEAQVAGMHVDVKHAILDAQLRASAAPADLNTLVKASAPAGGSFFGGPLLAAVAPQAAAPRPLAGAPTPPSPAPVASAPVASMPVASPLVAPSPAPPAVASRAPAPTSAPARPAREDEPVEVVPMTTLRRRIAERLIEAQSTAAILTTFNEIDMSRVMALRALHQERFSQKYGIKLGFMSFFVKAAIDALKAFPAANAEIRGTDIVYKQFWHVGVAVAGPRGLVVPVLRHADRLSFAETEQAIAAFGQKAKDGTLTVDDLQGGTFTISNGGTFGSMMSTPILNSPQVAILGMHAIQKRAVVVPRPAELGGGDEIVIRPMMYVALSYDHRLLDGREAVLTLVRIKECVENPERILLEV